MAKPILSLLVILALSCLAASDLTRIGYFTQWGIYSGTTFAALDKRGAASALTHIYYAFAGVTSDGLCTVTAGSTSDSWADFIKSFSSSESVDGTSDAWNQPLRGNFNQIKQLKKKYPALKVLISIGGGSGSKYFSNIAQTDDGRKKFVNSCIDIYIKGNLPVTSNAGGVGAAAGVFDGIDIDWEYPATDMGNGNIYRPSDTQTYTLLLQEFRTQLKAITAQTKKTYLLNAALPTVPSVIARIEVAKVKSILDYFGLMTYDLRGFTSTGPTNFHSNLYPDPANPQTGEDKDLSVDNAVSIYLKAGVSPSKIIVGIPYYGRGWTGVPNKNNGLYQPASKLAQGAAEVGSEIYRTLATVNGTVYYHPVTKQLWKFDGKTFWSYDDATVIQAKGAYIKSKGLAGCMVWSLDQEDDAATLSKALYKFIS